MPNTHESCNAPDATPGALPDIAGTLEPGASAPRRHGARLDGCEPPPHEGCRSSPLPRARRAASSQAAPTRACPSSTCSTLHPSLALAMRSQRPPSSSRSTPTGWANTAARARSHCGRAARKRSLASSRTATRGGYPSSLKAATQAWWAAVCLLQTRSSCRYHA